MSSYKKKKCTTTFFFSHFFESIIKSCFFEKRLTETGYDMIIFWMLITLALCKDTLGVLHSCSCAFDVYTQNIM